MKKINPRRLVKHKKHYPNKTILAVKKLFERKIFGFTLIELIVVISIIAILATISLITYPSIQRNANVASVHQNLRDASKQLNIFQVINSSLPVTIDCSQPDSITNICLNFNNNETVKYFTNINNDQHYYVTVENNGYTYNIDENGAIFAGPAPVLNSSADNYVFYNGVGNTWIDINTNSIQNGGFFDFNGSNNFISSIYSTNSDSENITIAAWVRPGGKNGTYEIMNQGQWGTDYWPKWSFSQTGQTIKFNLTDKYSENYQCSGGQFTTNDWSYITGVWDGDFMRTYLDGVEISSCSESIAIDAAKGPRPIGKYADESYYFNGMTGDITVYDESLSASEIRENYIIYSNYYKL